MNRTVFTVLAASALISCSVDAAAAEAYPSQPIKWVVPFPPGGAMDTMARTLGESLSVSMKQPVVVENRPGAGGAIGSGIVARAAPDGHTMLIVSVGHAVNPSIYPKLQYDATRDFEPVSLVGIVPNLLVAHPSVKANNVKELVALAKARPGKLTYASAGNGTTVHLAAELFNSMAGVDIVHVPYKGSAPAVTDLMGGQVDIMFDSLSSAKPYVESGRLKALAVTTAKRSSVFPNVPTISESGLPGYELSGWYAVFVPARTPKPIVDRLNAELVKALKQANVRARFAQIGAEPVGSSPQELAATLKTETARWAQIVRERNIKAD
ncbi:Bug family tripartite tricarboxylate transporter substrate binding protein [Massilia litorea]|jgi:tripartite-type tricarboxylate transporter receptor subunit TctC|uniref:Tripartite tricarboxylate transporter substrate binding protein n=1 Tax=Massilia litorea TaxID=2769491 RepID=A0A7L9U1S3_9BURK|nr:tripartite tricarboxylate transporter substrate binding protein [Massilia litorea]QOL48973.1 tripartite tricarboxylate transporter substrate binding protein [Massilia litorea]